MAQGDPYGVVESGWEPVREAFTENFRAGREVGAAVAVYHRGRLVVDLQGGWVDRDGSSIYDDRTLQLVFSTTKGITAIAVAMCVHRGLLAYEDKVTKHWPEFAAAGKENVTVAQLLSHQAGLVSVDPPLSLDDVLGWTGLVNKLAAQKPIWEPGTGHGYHAVTFGHLAGELVRRVDPQHRSLGRFVREEICQPLDVEFWIGLPPDQEARLSPIIPAPPPADPQMRQMMEMFLGPGTLGWRALTLEGTLGLETDIFNQPRFHQAEVPGANGITNARSLAKIYAATVNEFPGARLMSRKVRDVARTTVTPANEPDKVLILPSTFGMGFMTHGGLTPYLGPGSYGHTGAGGSVAFALPEAQIGFAYVMNKMDVTPIDPRNVALFDAVKQVLG